MAEALDKENNGSLAPIVELLTGAQIQGCLMALLPSLVALDTGNMVVDMFVISSLVTLVMAFLGLGGSVIRQIIDDDTEAKNDTNLSVKIEFHRMDRWNEPQENLHWKALAWLITLKSKHQTKGEYRMVPYIPENDGDSDSETKRMKMVIPHFNILPRGDRELEIEHEGQNFVVQFDLSNQNNTSGGGEGDDKKRAEVNPMIVRNATLEEMQTFLNTVSKMYAKDQCSKKRRARYERPAEYSYWTFVQNLRSTQEELLLKDLETFTQDREFYKRMGLPYRRGYLFSGKPGTGKTSLINAISLHVHNRDLYYIDLQEIKSDNELQSAFSSVPKNAIIVFEDIDAQSGEVHSRERRFALRKVDRFRTFQEKRIERKKKKVEELAEKDSDEEDEDGDEGNGGGGEEAQDGEDGDGEEEREIKKTPKKKKKTVADIVDIVPDDVFSEFGDLGWRWIWGCWVWRIWRCWGGFAGPALPPGMGADGHMLNENVIIIMTSNHPEVLDPALIRPGRIDLHLSLGYCTHYQLNRMYQSVMDDPTATLDFSSYPVPEHTIAPVTRLIPLRLWERGMEILEGKPLTTGIQAGESSVKKVAVEVVDNVKGSKVGDEQSESVSEDVSVGMNVDESVVPTLLLKGSRRERIRKREEISHHLAIVAQYSLLLPQFLATG
ncbi:P-loop containing nucleoside triphosphate hydrolase protein [Rhizoclosmatium globosum]|uniref:p-loop containing nucleoside triphosphate hydrolase protein n=1 Tax=Rhizoclosmatium globosum TaxID=329046 RepID=A0A1Y2BQI0_9FUNG|nr:P-loop containing nucleoside triphosphate hydrolase protein [Rhizoclosmatium globosum]|eukprot:ORY37001.1 P-loop containing nucleoside triphosphate hydrolase protein [Rhizoclosmatium globosum]